MNTPIVLIIFKRPETTKKVLEAIRQARPEMLFVIADGPRLDREGEAEKCAETRSIVDQIDWNCEVIKNYSDVNLGCGRRVSSGLDWVFSQVEEAIILEDDCLPHQTFFPFCEELLKLYRNDLSISSISAQNFYDINTDQKSYHFSRYPHVWGWATWKRAWQHYDFYLNDWIKNTEKTLLSSILTDSNAVRTWEEILQNVYDKKIDTWDYQWTFSCWLQNSLSIHPCTNLVMNIGFGVDATHTANSNSPFASLPITAMQFPLQHPSSIIRDIQADDYIQKVIFDVSQIQRLKNKLRRVAHTILDKVSGINYL
jgi:hypothetical protein